MRTWVARKRVMFGRGFIAKWREVLVAADLVPEFASCSGSHAESMMSTTRALTTKDRRWPWLGAVCAGISINAFGGAIGLASGAIDLSTEAHARLPLSNTALAGLALVLVVGVPMGLAAASALAGGGKTGPSPTRRAYCSLPG